MGNQHTVSSAALPPRSFESLSDAIQQSLPLTFIQTYRRPGWPAPIIDEPLGSLTNTNLCWGKSSTTPNQRGSYADLREFESYADYVSSTRDTPRRQPPAASLSTSGDAKNERSNLLNAAERMARVLRQTKVSVHVYGARSNHFSFLEASIFENVLPFIFDENLITAMSVCPHWFNAIYSFLKLASGPVVQKFIQACTGPVEYVGSTLSLQPLFTAGQQSVRVDCLMYARVTPSAVGKCTQLGYSYRYANKPETPSGVVPPEGSSFCPDDDRSYTHLFRFETLRKGSCRVLWLQRDLTRFHGDEIMVARVAVVPTVVVDDLIEIPVPLSHGFGRVDIPSIQWDTPVSVPDSLRGFGQTSEYERKDANWTTLEEFQKTTSERLQVNDIFQPQWEHKKTRFTGVDIAVSRSEYVAAVIGPVAQSRRWLGVDCAVVGKNEAVVVPLTRLGLQHDRFDKLQARLGDKIVLFIGQGGGIVQ